MFSGWSLPVLAGIFIAAVAVVWVAGVQLSDAVDVLADRLGFGQALGGLILLAIATNLPEIAIVGSAAVHHNFDIATGNILGGIAIQTVVLVVLDGFGVRGGSPLSSRVSSLVPVLEGVLVLAVLGVVVMAKQLPPSLIVWRIGPGELAIAALWLAGLYTINKARGGLPWRAKPDTDATSADGKNNGDNKGSDSSTTQKMSTPRAVLIFAVAAGATLAAGVALEQSGSGIAEKIGLSGVLFGATVLAASTAIPEVSTGLASVRLGDHDLAFSDIFGGNAFLPVLFLGATLLGGAAVIPNAGKADIYLAGLAALLTAVYLYGLIFRPRKHIGGQGGIGIDSFVTLALYIVGIVGLIAVSRGGG